MDKAKEAAGKQAAEWIESGMIVGLGTGSTAAYFIASLIERCKRGLKISAVSSSRESEMAALRGGIEVLNINSVSRIDIAVDGADEIDAKKRMIKGGGGAHVRERILAAASNEMVVIVDESKVVSSIGTRKLPVEILSFGSEWARRRLEEMGYRGEWRQKAGAPFITENGNLLYDIQFKSPPPSPENDHERIMHVPGVVDTGFFFGYAGRVIIGNAKGGVKIVA